MRVRMHQSILPHAWVSNFSTMVSLPFGRSWRIVTSSPAHSRTPGNFGLGSSVVAVSQENGAIRLIFLERCVDQFAGMLRLARIGRRLGLGEQVGKRYRTTSEAAAKLLWDARQAAIRGAMAAACRRAWFVSVIYLVQFHAPCHRCVDAAAPVFRPGLSGASCRASSPARNTSSATPTKANRAHSRTATSSATTPMR